MKIQIDRIPQGGKRFELEEPASQYNIAYLDYVFSHPICIDFRAQVVSGNLVVSGSIGTKIGMMCSRCLKKFSRDWKDSSYNFDCQIQGPNDIIDLTDSIREDIIIGLPVNPLCKVDCQGLCAVCGIDKNAAMCRCKKKKTDIRLLELDQLKLE